MAGFRVPNALPLDLVCFDYYGAENVGQVEAVLTVNPGLADYGPILPVGTLINLPVLRTQVSAATRLRLWG